MATKKNKKKVIDGFVKDTKKKSQKGSPSKTPTSKTKKSTSKISKSQSEKKVDNVAIEESIIETTQTDNADKSDATIEEYPAEISSTEIIKVEIQDSEPESDSDLDSEPQPESDSEPNSNSELKPESEVEPESETESKPESKAEKVEVTINSPIDEGENLAMNAIMDEEAIDENLDELINDIEKDEKEQKSKKEKKSTKKEKDNLSPKKQKKLPARALPFRILSCIFALATIGAVTSAVVRIYLTGIVPNKYLIPATAVLAIILLFYLFKTLRRKTHIPVLIILNLIGIALSVVSIFGFVKIQETMNFLFNNFNESKEYTIYNVIVNNKSTYTNLNDVRGKTFHSISDFVDFERLETAAREQANATIAYEDGISSLLKNTLNDNSYIAVLNAGTWEATLGLNDGKNDYVGKYTIIGELKVEEEKKNEVIESNITTESSVIFISGIDTRSGLMLDRSLSDVNMVVTINPKTKHILMTTIPRDYYVQLHGTSGLPDKLTHAGALGGLELSMSTIEDLLDFKFNRYIRVNFNFVINLVNAVGGITLYSDVDYPITAWTNKACSYTPGNNQVDGECALAFARERYAYSDGDRHRGRNQEQVIEKIFDKLTSSTTLISRYSDILNSLNGSFDTSISANDITSLANMQLNDMAKWTVETYNLDGTTGMTYTYSYPNQLLSVMYPDEATVETARLKIKQVLAGTIEAAPAETVEETVIEE